MNTFDMQSVVFRIFPAPLGLLASKVLGFERIHDTYESLQALDATRPITERLLEFMEVTYRASSQDLAHIPRKGAAMIVANHPFGILEAAVLVTVLRQIRPDVRILANDILRGIPELQELVIPIDVSPGSAGSNWAGARRAIEFLKQGGLLVVFPAGTVSHFQWGTRTSSDPEWNPAIARLISIASKGATNPVVVPVYVPGSNSVLFHAAGLVSPRLRTALLARELLNKKKTTVELRIGRPIQAAKLESMPSDQARIDYLRWRTYLLANRQPFKADTSRPLAVRRDGGLADTTASVSPKSSRRK